MNDPIRIEYGAAPCRTYWLPTVWIDGRRFGHAYWPTGYEHDEAVRLAEVAARAEAARYIGDWTVTVERRP
jgi:hypothetical protein